MFNYIQADLKRILTKKSFYIFLAINILLFEAIVFITSDATLSENSYLSLITIIIDLMPLVVGIYIFSVVYMDDLRSKSIQSAIGFGFKRSEIILVKFINTILISLIALISMFGVIVTTGFVYGLKLDASMIELIFKSLAMGALTIMMYASLSILGVYGLQKIAPSMTIFILMVGNTVHFMLSLILNQDFMINIFGETTQYLPAELIDSLSESFITQIKLESYVLPLLVLYFVGSFVGATLLFRHKELEF